LGNIIKFRSRPTDQERFESLVRPHFDALYLSALRLARNEQDAEDLLQEVLMKALAWLEELEQVDFPRAWLTKVMYNTFVDSRRKEQRSPLSMAEEAANDPDHLPAHDDSLALLFDRQRRIERVLRAMRHMNSEDCVMIGMHDVEGLTITELNQVTGLPEGTIKARLHRARKKLGKLLSNDPVATPRLRVVGGKENEL
jgi:RNA polymerase sigma-70 factor (ECF subfamily)